MEVFLGFILLCIVGYIYFIPTIIASNKQHKNTTSILILNVLGGWTCILWIAALLWAIHNE